MHSTFAQVVAILAAGIRADGTREMQRCTRMGVAILVAALLAETNLRAALLIDSFDNGSQTSQYTGAAAGSAGPNSASDVLWLQNPIGDERTIEAAKTNNTGEPLAVVINVLAGAGHTHLTNDAGTLATWSITYGSSFDLNLNLMGESAFRFDFDTFDTSIAAQAIITTTGSGSSFSGAFFTLSGTLLIDFSEFDGGSADLGDVDSMTFLFDSTQQPISRNAFLTQIEAVPEPAAIALFATLALTLRARRRRSARPSNAPSIAPARRHG